MFRRHLESYGHHSAQRPSPDSGPVGADLSDAATTSYVCLSATSKPRCQLRVNILPRFNYTMGALLGALLVGGVEHEQNGIHDSSIRFHQRRLSAQSRRRARTAPGIRARRRGALPGYHREDLDHDHARSGRRDVEGQRDLHGTQGRSRRGRALVDAGHRSHARQQHADDTNPTTPGCAA